MISRVQRRPIYTLDHGLGCEGLLIFPLKFILYQKLLVPRAHVHIVLSLRAIALTLICVDKRLFLLITQIPTFGQAKMTFGMFFKKLSGDIRGWFRFLLISF